MAQETYAAILRLVNPEVNKGFSVSFTFPNASKPTTFTWDAKNGYQTEVPTKTTYVDDHKRTVVFHTNYAKDVLNAYGKSAKKKELRLLEFVKECKRDEYVQPDFPVVEQKVEEPKVESIPETPKENKKEKQNEKK